MILYRFDVLSMETFEGRTVVFEGDSFMEERDSIGLDENELNEEKSGFEPGGGFSALAGIGGGSLGEDGGRGLDWIEDPGKIDSGLIFDDNALLGV